ERRGCGRLVDAALCLTRSTAALGGECLRARQADDGRAALVPLHGAPELGQRSIFTGTDVQAPNRLRLRTNTGFRSVIIGGTRWDFLGGRWERQRFPGLDVRDVLMWYDARTPRVVGRKANGDTDLAAFSLKPVPSWFRLTVEPSGRVSHAEMTAPSHFMLHRYSEFDRAPR